MMQGDAYSIPISISLNDTAVTPGTAEAMEIMIGTLRKTYPGEITFSEQIGEWLLPLSQEDTLQLSAGKQSAQVRVRLASGEVIGASCGLIDVEASRSQEVL